MEILNFRNSEFEQSLDTTAKYQHRQINYVVECCNIKTRTSHDRNGNSEFEQSLDTTATKKKNLCNHYTQPHSEFSDLEFGQSPDLKITTQILSNITQQILNRPKTIQLEVKCLIVCFCVCVFVCVCVCL